MRVKQNIKSTEIKPAYLRPKQTVLVRIWTAGRDAMISCQIKALQSLGLFLKLSYLFAGIGRVALMRTLLDGLCPTVLFPFRLSYLSFANVSV